MNDKDTLTPYHRPLRQIIKAWILKLLLSEDEMQAIDALHTTTTLNVHEHGHATDRPHSITNHDNLEDMKDAMIRVIDATTIRGR